MGNVRLKTISMLSALPLVRKRMYSMMFCRDNHLPVEPEEPDPERGKRWRQAKDEGRAVLKKLRTENLTLKNSRGNEIRACLAFAPEATDRYVILSHGYRSEGMGEFLVMVPWYISRGVNLLIVDHQAHGTSEGKIITFGGQEHVDLLQWARYLTDRFGQEIRIMLHGVSMGAATVMLASGSPALPPQVKAVAADCGYTSLQEEILSNFRRFGVPESAWPAIRSRFERETGLKAEDISPLQAVKRCTVPLALIHGDRDVFVPSSMADVLHEACPHSTLLKVEGATHAESWWADRRAYTETLDRLLALL